MFICKDCLKEDRKWKADLIPSFGQCEVCGKTHPCADVDSENAKFDDTDDEA